MKFIEDLDGKVKRRKKQDSVRQVKNNPKMYRFSIGSLGASRLVFYDYFDDAAKAHIYLEEYLKKHNSKEDIKNKTHDGIDWDSV